MATPITNSAEIVYEYGDNKQDSALSNVATTNLLEEYGLIATKTSQNISFRKGENITYTIRVENNGTKPIYAVTIQDNLGNDVEPLLVFLDNSATMNRGGIITTITPTTTTPLTLSIPNTLEPGEIVIFSYIGRVRNDLEDTVTEITNSATIVGKEELEGGSTITVTPKPTITIQREQYASVAIEKSVNKSEIKAGEEFDYLFTLKNTGNLVAYNVTINDILPSGFTISSIQSDADGIITQFDATDYSINPVNNELTLPTSTTKEITVTPKAGTGTGETIVTITGAIN